MFCQTYKNKQAHYSKFSSVSAGEGFLVSELQVRGLCTSISLLNLNTCIHTAAMSGKTDKMDWTGLSHFKTTTNLTWVSSAPNYTLLLCEDSALPSLFSNLQPLPSGKNLTLLPSP